MATHRSSLAWKIPWTVEPGGLQIWGRCVGRDRTQQSPQCERVPFSPPPPSRSPEGKVLLGGDRARMEGIYKVRGDQAAWVPLAEQEGLCSHRGSWEADLLPSQRVSRGRAGRRLAGLSRELRLLGRWRRGCCWHVSSVMARSFPLPTGKGGKHSQLPDCCFVAFVKALISPACTGQAATPSTHTHTHTHTHARTVTHWLLERCWHTLGRQQHSGRSQITLWDPRSLSSLDTGLLRVCPLQRKRTPHMGTD